MSYEEAQLEVLCVAESPSEPGTWCRGCIKNKIIENDTWHFRVFFVDYGDYITVPLNKLRRLQSEYISRLPFQAIACSLHGVGPKIAGVGWTREDTAFFVSLTRDVKGYMHELNVQGKFKETVVDEVTKGPHYHVFLINRQETEPQNLAEQMISQQHAIPIKSDQDFHAALNTSTTLKKGMEAEELKETARKAQHLVEDEDELKFDISTDWIEYVFKCTKIGSDPIPQISATTGGSISTQMNPKTSDASNLALIDHTMPLKDKESRFPTTKWWQNHNTVYVTFFIENVDASYTLELRENHLSFLADVNGLR